jgi:hypothetical protein
MARTMTDFLVSLADSENHVLYNRDPDGFMRDAGLTESQRKAVTNGDKNSVRRFACEEMRDVSVHAKVASDMYAEIDPNFRLIETGEYLAAPIDADADIDQDQDEDVNNDDDVGNTLDVGDDIAEFSHKYSVGPHYDHLFDESWTPTSNGELVFVGTGIKGAHHLTAEAILHIKTADKVLYCVADVVVERKLRLLNDNCEDMYSLYGDDKPRRRTYEEMVDRCIDALDQFGKVCAVYYRHPGIFVWPGFRAIQRARRKGINAYMLPGVSSLDCMFADVGFDPSRHGCQIFEATDFLSRSKKPNLGAAVIILQIGAVGDMGFRFRGYDKRNMPIFVEYLESFYGPEHQVILYEAAQYPVCKPKIQRLPIKQITAAKPSGITSLYLPPKILPAINEEMLDRLGLKRPSFKE